jgi:drug/metabolite transporter (DMT)-like permease
MASSVIACAAYAASSLMIIFANKFVMQVLRDPFALLLGQVLATLFFSFGAFCFVKHPGYKAFFNIRNVGWFAIIGVSSFVGWAASLEGLKSGSVATLTMIKAANPLVAAILAHFFLPASQPHRISRHLVWAMLAGVGCCFYVYDRSTADIRACCFFFISVLSASINAVSLKRMQLHSLLPDDALSSVLCSSALINAAALPFVLVAFLNTASSEVAVQVLCSYCDEFIFLFISHADGDFAVRAFLTRCFGPEPGFFYCDFAVGVLGPETPQLHHIHCIYQLLQNTRRHHQHAYGSGRLRKLQLLAHFGVCALDRRIFSVHVFIDQR